MEELSTEQKILNAAKEIFTQKGFTATKTRDIAQAAGSNLALLNYYYGSKENLFKLVLKEKFEALFSILVPFLSDKNTSLEEKVKLLVENYTQLLTDNEELPIFILNELKNNENLFEEALQKARSESQPVIEEQLKEQGFSISWEDFVINIISLTIFPFVAKSLFVSAGVIDEDNFSSFIESRKKRIPEWIFIMSKKE